MARINGYPKSVQPGVPVLSETPHGWEKAPLGKYLKEIRRPAKLTDEEEYQLVTVKRARGGVIEREHLLGKQIKTKTQFFVKSGDFLISKRQIVHGACGLVPSNLDGAIVSNEYSVITDEGGLDLEFLQYLSESIYFQQTCFHSSIGVHVEKMIFNVDRWLKWPFNLPPIEEQLKISKVLSTWDKAITTTKQLLANSQQQKKALIQQLLTGEIRFPQFDGEWQELKLIQICEFKKGNGLSKDVISDSGKHKCVLYGQLYTKYGEVIKNIVSRTDSEEGTKSVAGDILIPSSTTTSGIDLANAVALLEDNVLLGGDINILRPNRNRVHSEFLAYLLTHGKKHEIASLAQGITIIHLYGNDLKPVKVRLPSCEEQQKIAAILAAADREIETLQQKLTCLEQEKKALMQQLLIGKRRVKIDEPVIRDAHVA